MNQSLIQPQTEAKIDYFARYLLEEASGSVTVADLKQRALENNVASSDEIDSHLYSPDKSIYDIEQKTGQTLINDVSPTGPCPNEIKPLFESIGINAPDLLSGPEESDSMSLDPQSDISQLDSLSDVKADALKHAGFETLSEVNHASAEDLVSVPGLTMPEARTIKKEIELISQPAEGPALLAVKRDLGLSTPTIGCPLDLDLNSLTEEARDVTPRGNVVDFNQVTTPPGKPLVVSDKWDGETQWHYNELPILDDPSHPLIPDMESAVPPKEIRIKTGQNVSKEICDGLKIKKPLLLEGPHGCGKNYWLNYIMWKTNRPAIAFDLNEGMLAEHLIGAMSPQEDGSIEFEKKLIPHCAENGISIIINELRAASQDVQIALHQLLNANMLVLEEANEAIEPHPMFQIMATTNPNTVDYGPMGALNPALIDRFRVIPFDYVSKSDEIDLLDSKFNSERQVIPRHIISSIVNIGRKTRNKREYPLISTRKFEDILIRAHQSGNPRGSLKTVLETLEERQHDLSSLEQAINDTVPKEMD